MKRLELSLILGVACAVLLTMIRGGWRDAPLVVPVFAAMGFLATYTIASVIGSERIARMDVASRQRRHLSLIRDAAALVLVVMSLVWSGRAIQGAGFAGWLVALILGVFVPFVVCLLASRWTIAFGLAAATSLAVSTLLHHPDFRQGAFAREPWQEFVQRDIGVWLILWCILAGLSHLVSVPLAVRRRHVATRCRDATASGAA